VITVSILGADRRQFLEGYKLPLLVFSVSGYFQLFICDFVAVMWLFGVRWWWWIVRSNSAVWLNDWLIVINIFLFNTKWRARAHQLLSRGVAIKSGLGGRNRRLAPKKFFCTSPPISAFGGDLMTYHCTGQKTFKTQRKQYIWAYRLTDILLLT